ncbi:MAG: hypothetical protein ACFFE6_07085 [Candidatus Thorarchaeota archaeon]
MKSSGLCPKCESSNIWSNSETKQKGPAPVKRWIMVVPAFMPHNRKYAFKEEYVCLDCGYSETFIDVEGLKTIREYGFSQLEY